MVWVRLPVTLRTPPEALPTKTVPLVTRLPERFVVPALMVVVPFQEFAAPERVSVPVPVLVRAPVPLIMPERVWLFVPL